MNCRSCGGETVEALTLGSQVPANRFVAEKDLKEPEPRYDLTVMLCGDCGLAQLRTLVPPEDLFSRYPYRHGSAPALHRHLASIASRYGGPGKVVVEVGSNDGLLLSKFKGTGSKVLGIEPAANLAALANADGLPTTVAFFGSGMECEVPAADVVVARNVFAHVPDSHGFVEAVGRILKPEGVLVVETPWVASHFMNADCGNLYHEHAYYFGIASMSSLLRQHGFDIADARLVHVHGGSLQLEIRRKPERQSAEVFAYETRERKMGVYTIPGWQDFHDDSEKAMKSFRRVLRERKGRVVGYAAAAKGMVLLQWGGIGRDLLPAIFDTTPEKQGLFSPATHIPILGPDRMIEYDADYLAVLAFNWLDAIREDPTLRKYRMFSADGREV